MALDVGVHLGSLRARGYAVVEQLLPRSLLDEVQAAALSLFPPEPEVRADPVGAGVRDGLLFRSFPFASPALSTVALRDDVLDLAAAAFAGRAPFLTQTLVRASYGGLGDVDQELHRDFSDNSLLVPSDDPAFDQLALLVYLTDVTPDDAPTHVCPRHDTDDRALWPRARRPEDDPDLYALERAVVGPAGTAILYTMATFHRGSRFRSGKGHRLVLHAVLRPAGNEWQQFSTFTFGFETEAGRGLMAALTPRQRTTIGVPPPGSPYWTRSTLTATASRYPGFDTAPYEAALSA